MTPAQQLSKVREVVKAWKRDINRHAGDDAMEDIERLVSAPEGEAAGAGEAVASGPRMGSWTVHEGFDSQRAYDYKQTKNADEKSFDLGWRAGFCYAQGMTMSCTCNQYPHANWCGRPIVAAPPAPKASAQALTEREIFRAWDSARDQGWLAIARAIERAFCEKNGIPAPARMNDDKQEGAA